MWGRRILFIAAIAAAIWYLRQHSASNVKPLSKVTGGDKPSAAYGCVAAADRANDALHAAAMIALRPPVDASAWANEEGKVSSTIETAESTCSGASSDTDRHAAEEARAALAVMRSSLSDLSSAARGQGGAMDVSRRQGEIDDHLNAARGR
ncbi:MAG TPA: hypothetical protein VKF32_04505 [Thermoanaerobaculia bacterium]|nr:hypothetical protein [Thermoanaerobaculia bacterium]